VFTSLLEASVVINDYRKFILEGRPHSSLDYRTPKEFAEVCARLKAANAAAVVTTNAESRVDGAGDEAPLPLQTSPSTPLAVAKSQKIGIKSPCRYNLNPSSVLAQAMQAGHNHCVTAST